MNLNLKIDGETVDLFQTPTGISYMCQTHLPMEGKSSKAQNIKVIETYCIWVEDVLYGNGVFHTDEEWEAWKADRAKAKAHCNDLKSRMFLAKKVEAWVM